MHVKWLETNRTRKTSWYIVIISTFVMYFHLFAHIDTLEREVMLCHGCTSKYILAALILYNLYFIILRWYCLLLNWSLYLLRSMIWQYLFIVYKKKLDALFNVCDLLSFFNSLNIYLDIINLINIWRIM